MTAFGQSPLGTALGPFGGAGLITVLGVLPLSTNQFVVVFDREPYTLDTQAFYSASNENNYILAATDPTLFPPAASVPTVPKGESVPRRFPYSGIAESDPADLTQAIITSDSRLEPNVVYTVTVNSNIRGLNDEVFAGNQTFDFRGLALPDKQFTLVETSEDRYRDFDNIIDKLNNSEETQTYRFDPSGDLALSDARTSLRKRIYRRLFTDPGGFAWAPTYGVGVKVKQLIRPGTQQNLASLVAEQVGMEPDVLQASAEVSFQNTNTGSFVFIDLWVRMADTTTTRITFQEPA